MKTNKIYSLQVYRAIAAILVVLYHMTDLSQKRFDYTFMGGIFSFGYVGVDFFFVLSGFIILYVHNTDLGRKEQLPGYFTKRFIRLYPIYWCVASVKIFVVFVMPSFAKSYETDFGYLVRSLLLVPQQNLPIIGAAWTLSYEILFYMLFGIAILIGARWALRLVTIWSIAIMGSLVLKIVNEPIFDTNFFIRFLFDERNLEFILGCLAAYLILNIRVKYGKLIAATGGLLFLFWGWYLNQGSTVFSFTFTFGLASFLLVIGSASIELQKHIRWPKILIFLGDASYSIYLTHVMFLNIFTLVFLRFGRLFQVHPFFVSLIMVVFAISGGSAAYVLVEKPLIRSLRKRMLPSPKFGQSVVIVSSKS